MGRLGILAGRGSLPVELTKARPDALPITLHGVAHDLGDKTTEHRFEKLGALFDDLKARDITEIVFAGGMARPKLDPKHFDLFMQGVAPRLLAAFQEGDDHLLRLVITLFEEQGIKVCGAHEILDGLTAEPGLMAGPTPDEASLQDAAKGAEILASLAPHDVGQGVVAAAGLCLGIETLQGTDALLRFVAETPSSLRRAKGCLVKLPKAGQDLRVDMPALGPETIRHAADAGLAGIVVAPGRVMILDRAETLALADTLGIFLYGDEALA